MSLRLLSHKLVKHGRYFLQAIWKREIYLKILEQQHNTRNRLQSSAKALKSAVTASPQQQQLVAKNVLQSTIGTGSQNGSLTARQANGIFRFGQHARKLFIDNLLNRCTSPYSQPLRSQATKKLFYGDSAPFFALIGVSLASGAGILTKEDELEGVCWEIREAANRLQKTWNYDDISDTLTTDFNIDKLNVGPPIAKGCAAVVYAASFKNQTNEATKENNLNETNINHVQKIETTDDLLASSCDAGDGLHNILKSSASYRPEFVTPLRNLSRFVHNFGSSVDNLQNVSETATIKQLKEVLNTLNLEKEKDKDFQNRRKSEERLNNAEGISSFKNQLQEQESDSDATDLVRYPLALKMMFNYDIQSNALAILRAMYKETVPARQRYINPVAEGWERLLEDQTLTLPPHPNIVTMFGFFCDEVKNFPDGHVLYPVAQPQRINPQGYGRNMSLYLLMKRYDYSLRNLLDSQDLSTRTKLLLFTQLLEAVAYINNHGIAHRDLKSDNILIEMNDDDSPPVLVISDFGCCLADKVHGLRIPYNSYDIDKGGNAALMAPEIINKQPGSFAVLNYTKADLWACGAIAYEIFGQPNPFYTYPHLQSKTLLSSKQYRALKNSNYKVEELPPLNETCPELIQNLIYNILDPNPSNRISADLAANVMQLYLWAPSKWIKSSEMPNSPEILQWLLSLTTKIMCEGNNSLGNLSSRVGLPEQLSFSQHGRRTFVEYLLICSFLARARLRCVRGALNWIQNTNNQN